MFSRPQLENYFRCKYPDSVSALTQERRAKDINALQSLIKDAREETPLQYGQLEERLFLFTTKAGERVAIQYPGKESVNADEAKICPYDFRPKIILADGTVVKDMAFVDMWGVIEELAAGYKDFIKFISAFFFRMGRMLLHTEVTEDYRYITLDQDGNEVSSGHRQLNWYRMVLDDEVLNSLPIHIPEIVLDDGTVISLEAFFYFFEMLLQNEDSKYFYKKRNLSSGRIQTSDSMLLLSSYFLGYTSLSTLLQRYISGFGVAKCPITEIPSATGNLIEIVKPRSVISEYLDTHNISYTSPATVRIEGRSISVVFKLSGSNLAILSSYDAAKAELLHGAGWQVFYLDTLIGDSEFNQFTEAVNR